MAKVARTTMKKARARSRRPSQACPRPGTSHASRHGAAALTRGRATGTGGCSTTVSVKPLLLDHPDPDLPRHLAMQLHGDGVDAERLDRLLDEDPALVELDSLPQQI